MGYNTLMTNILIITEDIVKIQTLTGLLGKTFQVIYLNWLKLRLKFLIIILKPFFKVTVVCSDFYRLNHKTCFYYRQELARINYDKINSETYQKIVERLLQSVALNQLFQARLAIFLTYHYFIYADLYQIILAKTKPDIVVTLSNSYHEQTARFIAQLNKIQVKNIFLFSFIWFNHWLKNFFLNREYTQKINNFINQSKHQRPKANQLKNATLLSLDFYRHLKTLAPIYEALEKQNKNPWLVTDITNLKQSLTNLQIPQANYLYLASFLPKKSIGINLKHWLDQSNQAIDSLVEIEAKDIVSFLYNLSLKTSKPILKHGFILSHLYLEAAEKLFSLVKPKGVIVISDVRFCELSLSHLAREYQVKSILASPNTLMDYLNLHSYDTTDEVTVVGNFIKNELINFGIDSKKIHLVGDPRIEKYQTLKPKLNKKKIYQTLSIDDKNKKIALLISFRSTWTIPKTEKKAFFQMAATAIKRTPDTVLVIKPHPTEKRYRVLEELKEWGINNVIVSDNNKLELVDLLYASSVILQTWSMTIFEAIMMNKPVIVINPFNKDYNYFMPCIKPGGAIEVKNKFQLDYWLPILLNSNHYQTKKQLYRAKNVCTQFIQPPDGKVTKRIIDLLFN